MTRFHGNVREGNSCGRPPVRGTSARLPPDASRSACASLRTAVCPSKGFAARSTTCTRLTHKQFRRHGLSEPERLCFLIRLVEVPLRGVINRKPWVEPKTRCPRRKPIRGEDLGHYCVLPIQLTDLNAFALLRGTARKLGTDDCPERPHLIRVLDASRRRLASGSSPGEVTPAPRVLGAVPPLCVTPARACWVHSTKKTYPIHSLAQGRALRLQKETCMRRPLLFLAHELERHESRQSPWLLGRETQHQDDSSHTRSVLL